jgi:sialic acid synthase SpsE
MPRINIGRRWIGDGEPTYFVADIAANHDGDLERAKELIHLAAESGADAAKFQNFRAPKIVSEYGFAHMAQQVSHQAWWEKSVYEVYEDASLPWDWTDTLKQECDRAGIDYFSAPYDFEAVDMLAPYVPVFKIGSGDITWPEMLKKVAQKGKPVMLATGASDISDIQRAVNIILSINPQLVLMQCNTNYTASAENFEHIHLRVLNTYRVMYPAILLGLSDHTPGGTTVLGAIALGAAVIEKHFTDDRRRQGPDHVFSMDPRAWSEMVQRSRELEAALGKGCKQVAENERETVVIQRRCLRAATDLPAGTMITRNMIDVLRPAPLDSIFPYDIERVIGMRLVRDIPCGEYFRWWFLSEPTDE